MHIQIIGLLMVKTEIQFAIRAEKFQYQLLIRLFPGFSDDIQYIVVGEIKDGSRVNFFKILPGNRV